MQQRYGEPGVRFSDVVVSGTAVTDFAEFPLFEDYVERARLTIVHSEYARTRVLDRLPGAEVVVVPMGIPLPALIDQQVARRAIGLSSSAFVVASITHVNPHKRIPVVMRAIRRLIEKLPDLVFVIAGSTSPGIDLQRLAGMYGIEQNVLILGYVSDDDARLVARAADVCVNLRYPSVGETSASLLRLLGAGRPVLVTDDASMAEYPRSAVLPIPVDEFEVEMIAESLRMLYKDDDARTAAGLAAREFVEGLHSMDAAVRGYSAAVAQAFGLRMAPVPHATVREEAPRIDTASAVAYSGVDGRVADALASLGLYNHETTIRRVSQAMTGLGLHLLTTERKGRADGDT
jgi:glycosyltransferase involved in cell wall biosynthesis